MDETEVKVIQRNFEYLVKQGKAEYLLDRLFTMEAVDLDDYQRVTAQVTDSDKMRMLLVILLKKVPSMDTKSFTALVIAFKEACRSDIAEMLTSRRQEYARNLNAAGGTSNASGSTGSQGFNFTSHDLTYPMRNKRVEGMDVADCLPKSNIKDQGETTLDNIVAKTPAELSSPDHSAGGSKDLVSVSSKELKQSIDSAKGTKGQMLLGGRVFQYEMKGVFEGGELKWNVSVNDQTTQKSAKRKGTEDRHDLLQECLMELVKMK